MEKKTESKNETAVSQDVLQGMEPCMDYFVLVRRTDPTYGASRALEQYLGENPEVACQLAQDLDLEDMPVDFDTLQERLKALGAVDAFRIGMSSWSSCNFSSAWFQIFDDRVESMSQLRFERWCASAVIEEYSEDIIDGDIEIPAQLRAVLDLFGPDGAELSRQYPCKYLESAEVRQ